MTSSKKNLSVLVYDSESELRHPLRLFRQMWMDLLQSRELSLQLFIRDTQAQYRQSVLGLLWAFIPPLLTALAATLLKDTLNLKNLTSTDIPYPLYVMFSMSLWLVFNSCVLAGVNGIKVAKGMMNKIRVPFEAFVLNYIGQALFKFGIQLILFFVLVIVYNLIGRPVTLSWWGLVAPVALVHLLALGVGIGLIIAPLASLYNDVMRLLDFALKGLFFVTPVVYNEPKEGIAGIIFQLNPISSLLATTRDLVITGTINEPMRFWLTSLIAFIVLFIGWIFNRIAVPLLIERGA